MLGNEDARNAVEKLLDQAKADVHKLLDDNRHLVIALRDELLRSEELVGDEIVDVLREAEARNRLVVFVESTGARREIMEDLEGRVVIVAHADTEPAPRSRG